MEDELYVEKALEAKARGRRAREAKGSEFTGLGDRLVRVETALAKLIKLLGYTEIK